MNINLPFPRPVLVSTLIVVAIFSWYLSSRDQQPAQDKDDKLPHVPNYFVRVLDTTSMGPDGLPARRVVSPYVVQYLDDETTELTTPDYYFYRTDQAPWHVHSEQGWLSADGELALLSGRVTILRAASENNKPFKMITSDVRIQPENNYLETDNAVTANSGPDQVDAIGMQAWVGEPGRIKFLSNVRALYVPKYKEISD